MYLLSKSDKNDVDYVEDEIELMKKDFVNLHMLYNKLTKKFYKSYKNPKQNYSGDTEIYNKILEIISNNFDTNDGLKLLFSYVDKFMKVYKQMKMYNDPGLNPVLYQQQKNSHS